MENHKIIIINGMGGVGKDTFVNYCLNNIYSNPKFINHRLTYSLSPSFPSADEKIKKQLIKMSNIDSVSLVKKIAKEVGWDGNKTETNRKFLSDLKDLLTNWQDVPYQFTLSKISQATQTIKDFNLLNSLIFVHSREPKEIQRYVSHYPKDKCFTLLVKNPNIPSIHTNHADKDVENYHYNFIVNNNGDLNNLEEKAKLFCEHVLLSKVKQFYYD